MIAEIIVDVFAGGLALVMILVGIEWWSDQSKGSRGR